MQEGELAGLEGLLADKEPQRMSGLRRKTGTSMFQTSLSGFAAQAWQTSTEQELLRTADWP
jgi:hypothetical protein